MARSCMVAAMGIVLLLNRRAISVRGEMCVGEGWLELCWARREKGHFDVKS